MSPTLISGVDLGLWLLTLSVVRHSAFNSAFLLEYRCLLGVETSWWSERGRVGSSGDGVASPGDTGDITGALTGRLDLLSGVDTIARMEETIASLCFWKQFNNNSL